MADAVEPGSASMPKNEQFLRKMQWRILSLRGAWEKDSLAKAGGNADADKDFTTILTQSFSVSLSVT